MGSPIDERSDIFSAGIILWELLNGRRLYRGENRQAPTLEMAAQAEIPPMRRRGYPLEEELHAIVGRALEKDPDRRFVTAQEMRVELETYVRETSLFASPLKFGQWLTEHFAEEILARRRTREVAAKAIAAEPLVKLTVSERPPRVTANGPPEVPEHGVRNAISAGAGTRAFLVGSFHNALARRPPMAWFAAAALVLMLVVLALWAR